MRIEKKQKNLKISSTYSTSKSKRGGKKEKNVETTKDDDFPNLDLDLSGLKKNNYFEV